MKLSTPFLQLLILALVASSSGATDPQRVASPGPSPTAEQDLLPADTQREIDNVALDLLKKSGAPSASIAVVKDGKLAYVHAYGMADTKTHLAAASTMRYSVGSISKQFTAAAILLLAEEGKLSLDDKVGRWLPDLTRANEITIRQILSMTSGYQDYWPQDYVMPDMIKPTSAQAILDGWARKPLDFEPGTKWQYSNTNYIIAGLIVEKIAGMPLFDFLQKRIFLPLEMKSVFDSDAAALPGRRANALSAFRSGPVAAGSEGRQGLALCGRRTGDDGGRTSPGGIFP